MRLRISSLRRIVKKNLSIEFVQQDLTSYWGLELVRRYFRLIDLNRRIRQSFNAYGLGGDYGCGRLLLLVITLFVVSGRQVLRMTCNPTTQTLYDRISHVLVT